MRRLSAVTEFPGQEKRSIFEPNRVVVEKLDGTVVEARDDPEKSFEGKCGTPLGMTSTRDSSVAKRCGRTSPPRSSTLTKGLRRKKLHPSARRAKRGDA